jgi:Rad3-related DNA helicase
MMSSQYYLHQQLVSDIFLTIARAVLVFFQSRKELANFREWLQQQSDHLKNRALVLTEDTKLTDRANMVERAVQSGQVTFLTRELGRGTDFSSEGVYLACMCVLLASLSFIVWI